MNIVLVGEIRLCINFCPKRIVGIANKANAKNISENLVILFFIELNSLGFICQILKLETV
jgi:hypothetical protein